MSLLDRFEAAPRTSRGLCRIKWILDNLNMEDQQALMDVLSVNVGDPDRLSSPVIVEILRDEGFNVHVKTVDNHRKGVCACGPVGQIETETEDPVL